MKGNRQRYTLMTNTLVFKADGAQCCSLSNKKSGIVVTKKLINMDLRSLNKDLICALIQIKGPAVLGFGN